jgi:hypothetical protein
MFSLLYFIQLVLHDILIKSFAFTKTAVKNSLHARDYESMCCVSKDISAFNKYRAISGAHISRNVSRLVL